MAKRPCVSYQHSGEGYCDDCGWPRREHAVALAAKRILGVDPGDTTGLILIDFPGIHVIDHHAYSLVELFDSLHHLTDMADIVACERFTITQRTIRGSRHNDAMYAIGWLMGLCHNRGILVQLQSPADAKSAFRDESLRQLDVYSHSRHIRDATRHALLCGRRNGYPVHVSV